MVVLYAPEERILPAGSSKEDMCAEDVLDLVCREFCFANQCKSLFDLRFAITGDLEADGRLFSQELSRVSSDPKKVKIVSFVNFLSNSDFNKSVENIAESYSVWFLSDEVREFVDWVFSYEKMRSLAENFGK